MLSIIIPTLNEEKNIKTLLAAIKKGGFKDYEIIVADAGSKDKTVEIARQNNCIITKGGLPARGRNNGAHVASGDILLFLDADIKLSPANFLKLSVDYFIKNDLAIASFRVFPQKENIFANPFTFNCFYNGLQKAFKKVFPMGAMGMMVRKDIFEKVKGFDESITLAEDHYFVQQAAKLGKFDIIKGVEIYMPLRRFERDGYFTTALKYLLCGIKLAMGKPERKVKYDFGHYDKK